MTNDLYPLRFQPIIRQYIWGGRRLASHLNKSIGSGDDYAESWELVDHGEDQSVVAHGHLSGETLSNLIHRFGSSLLGDSCVAQIGAANRPEQLRHRFPLLLKFLDANRVLSVQVHPDDEYGRTMSPPDLGKTEAWYVLHADPGSAIYAGLKTGVTRSDLAEAIQDGTTESCLHKITPQKGDCIFIPAGTVHAIGGGLLIAEIQQASDTTFRLFDWNRVDKNGNSRPLHVEQSLDVVNYDRGPVNPQLPQSNVEKAIDDQDSTQCQQLVACDKFVLNRWTSSKPISLGGDNRFRIIAITEGSAQVENDPAGKPLALAETMLIPASTGSTRLTPPSNLPAFELLEIRTAD